MNYRQEYEKWLASPALSEDERNELKAIANDEKEIENRFYGPLEFGTAGLRGTMYVGLHNMNRHVIRWATQGFANVIRAEGEEAMKKGVAICMDCRVNSMAFARAAAARPRPLGGREVVIVPGFSGTGGVSKGDSGPLRGDHRSTPGISVISSSSRFLR